MNRLSFFLLTLSFSILLGVDAPQEKFRDVESTQDKHQMKQEMKVMVTTDNLDMETVRFSSPPMDVTY